MPQFACPQCRAEIEPDLIEQTGRAECPFCGADLSAIGLPEADPIEDTVDAPVEMTVDGDPAPTGESARTLPPVPEKSGIKVVEVSEDRLVLFVPGGGKSAAGIGCFALIWNAGMSLFTMVFLFGTARGGNNDGPPLAVFGFLSLFWAVGLGIAWFWMKMKFERTFLLLDRERVVVQRVMLGRKRMEEAALGPDSRAELAESYQQNDVPVYRIEVKGSTGAAKFGTSLSDDEKDWIVERINEFLGVALELDDEAEDDDVVEDEDDDATDDADDDAEDDETDDNDDDAVKDDVATGRPSAVAGRCRSILVERSTGAAVSETMESTDCVVQVEESSRDRLKFCYALAPGSPIRQFVPGFLFVLGVAWFGFLGYWNRNTFVGPFGFGKVFDLLFLLPLFAAGLAPVALALYFRWGRTTIDLTREAISCRWSVGSLGFTRQLSTDGLDSVRVVREARSQVRRRGKNVPISDSGGANKPFYTCVARAGGKKLSLMFFNDEPLARRIAHLVGTKLGEMGFPLRHE